ncbi:MAG: hypothetical protein LUE27_08250 [Clostridia bacterium]|nr:hypothetical protein [Clostridia bacterium]
MITDPKYKELAEGSEDDLYAARRFMRKCFGEGFENDYNGRTALLRGLADAIYAADIDEEEFLLRGRRLAEEPYDDDLIISACSAMRYLKLYCLQNEDGKSPVFIFDEVWGDRTCLAFFTSKAMIPEDLLDEYSVHRTGIAQICKKLEKRSRAFTGIAINSGEDLLTFGKDDFANVFRDLDRTGDAIAYAFENGVDGEALFQAIAAHFAGHGISCRLSSGSVADGKAVSTGFSESGGDDEDGRFIRIDCGKGPVKDIPFADIEHISLSAHDLGSGRTQGSGKRRKKPTA